MESRFEAADATRLAGLIDEQVLSPGVPLSEGPGTRIGRYKLLQLIGEGGFGSVFMAEQESPVVRRVALKIIKLGMDTKQVIARFEAERQALAMMDHPNIAKVLDAGATETGRPYFVMELVPGIPITQYCDRKRLTLRQRIELFVPVCRAAQHAHQKGIIHRDLKPSNILVMVCDGRPVPKIIDFGVAKALHQRLTEKTLFTQFGGAVGTLEYMSPEQADMDVMGADTRSDVYSLGVLLYELLTGTTPVDRAKLRETGYAQMLRMIREEEPLKPSTRLTHSGDALASISADRGSDPRELARLTAGDLDWIVMKCLEKDRARRYETADGLARDLERYLGDEPVEASPPSARDKLRRFARKHRFGLSVTAGFAIVLLVATAVSTWQALRATRATAVKEAERRRADVQSREATAARQAAELNLADALIAQADALRADSQWGVAKDKYRQAISLLRANRQPSLPAELALWDASRRSPAPLMEFHAHDGEVTHLRFLPDGSQLATIGPDGVARLWETRTGRLIRTIPGLGDVQRLSVSPDGKLIVFASTSTGVTIWNVADGRLARTIHGFSGRASAVSFSPDARWLLVGTADPPYDLCLFDAASGDLVRKFPGHEASVRDVAFSPTGTRAFSCDGRPPGNTVAWGVPATLRAWDVVSGSLLWSDRADSNNRLVGALAVSPLGDCVACTAWDGVAKLYSILNGDVVERFPSIQGHDVQGIDFSGDGTLLAMGGPAGSIRLASSQDGPSSANGRLHGRFAGHAGDTRALAFSPDGRVLASGGTDGFVRLWPVYAGGEERVFPDFQPGKDIDETFSVALSSAGRRALTSTGQDRLIRLWDVPTGTEIARVTTAHGNNTSAVFGPGDRTIVLIDEAGRVGIWDESMRQRLDGVDPPAGRQFEAIALSPDGRTLLAGFADGNDLAVYDLPSHRSITYLTLGQTTHIDGTLANPPDTQPDRDRRLRFSPDGRFAAGITQRANLLKLWGTSDWQEWHSIPVPQPHRIAISPDSRRVACAAADVRVFDAQSGRLVNHFNEAADARGAVGFLPGGRYLLTLGVPPDSLVLWDLARSERVRALGYSTWVFDLAISGDGTFLWCERSGRGALNVAQLDWTARWDEMAPKLEPTRKRLQADPNDPQALAALADWYAFRGMPDWAVELLHRAGDPATEAQLLALCRRRARAEDPRSRPSPYDQGYWNWMVASKTREIQNKPNDPALLDARGALYAEMGRFQESLADYRRAVELAPENHKYWHDGFVAMLLQAGDVEGYRHWRSVELRRFSGATDKDVAHRVALDAFIRPMSDEDMKLAVALADQSLSADPNFWAACQTKGIAEYRSGHYKKAIPFLIKGRDLIMYRKYVPEFEFFLAMSYQRMGDFAQARAALNRGLKALASLSDGGKGASFGPPVEWIMSQFACREAQELIGGNPPARRPASTQPVPSQ